jgi:hypothetical protein
VNLAPHGREKSARYWQEAIAMRASGRARVRAERSVSEDAAHNAALATTGLRVRDFVTQ